MTDQTLYHIYLSLIASGLVVSIINRKHLGNYSTYMTVLLGMVLLFEWYDYEIDDKLAHFLNHVYQPLEFTLLALIYGKVLDYSWFKKAMLPMIAAFWGLSLFLSVEVEGLENENALSLVISYFLVVVFASIYHFQLLTNPVMGERLFRQPFFWINTAHLFFFLGAFFQMGFDAYLEKRWPYSAFDLCTIGYVLNLMLYSLYLVGFTCKQIFKSR